MAAQKPGRKPATEHTTTPRYDVSQYGRQGGYTKWAHVTDRTAATANMRRGWMARFDRQVDPAGALDPATRALLAEAAMRAYMTGLAVKSRQSRAAKKAATAGGKRAA